MIGKGVTFDTGGADLKVNGAMRGMSRDKCGAATICGMIKSASLMQPKHLNIKAYLGLVRNSIGANAYICDEVILSRAGVRVLIGNTDAEGRMVMSDLLAEAKEIVIKNQKDSIQRELFTVATLTGKYHHKYQFTELIFIGHALLSHGHYSISMDNGKARKLGITKRLVEAGEITGEPFEISTLRREDFEMTKPGSDQEDVIQANSKPSTQTLRGHQFPMAFMIVASSLDKVLEIPYSHLDIAGSAGFPAVGNGISEATGVPLASLINCFVEK